MRHILVLIMTLTVAAIPSALAPLPARAADLGPMIIAPPPVLVPRRTDLCLLTVPVSVYRAPLSRAEGILPAGLQVQIVEPDWSVVTDLWVRIRAERPDVYYGWVFTRDLFCH